MKLNKQLFIGLILGITFTISLPVIADTTQLLLDKVNYKLIINGELYNTKSDILSYKGTTYLPLREVGNALDLDLSFKSGVINIDSNDKTSISPMAKPDITPEVIVEPEKIARTPEEIERIIKENDIPTDSDLARDLRENPYLNFNTPSKNKDVIVDNNELKLFVDYNKEIDGCIPVPIMKSKDRQKPLSNVLVNSNGDLLYKLKDEIPINIKYENIPKGSIKQVDVFNPILNEKIITSVKCGIIEGVTYLDKNLVMMLIQEYK